MNKAEATKLNILQKAFDLIYVKGYQTTSIDDILATTRVTKGAFYYHFKNKDEMGLAIINDLLKPSLIIGFKELSEKAGNPLDTIYNLIHHLLVENEFLKAEYGCPVANFTQEMSPWNIQFTTALSQITELWSNSISTLIRNGKKQNLIRKEVDAKQVTLFVLSGYWGIRSIGKLDNNKSVYKVFLKELKSYLTSLKK